MDKENQMELKEKNEIELKEKNNIEWYDNPNLITTIGIITLILVIVLSQSFAVKNNMSSNEILRSLLNHNSIYLVGLLYFVPLKTKSGKKYFDFFNLFFVLIYGIFTITSILTVIQSFGLTSIVNLCINIMLLTYMVHSLLYNTRIWKEFKLENSPFNEIKNINYFYTVIILSVVSLTVNLIQASTFDGAFLSILGTIYIMILSRYIYLYKEHINKKMMEKSAKKKSTKKKKGEA